MANIKDSIDEVAFPKSSDVVEFPDSSDEVQQSAMANIEDSNDEVAVPDSIDEVAVPDSIDEVAVPDSIDDVAVPDSIDDVAVPDSIDDEAVPDSIDEGAFPDSSDDMEFLDSSDEDEGSEVAIGLDFMLRIMFAKLGFLQIEEEKYEQVLDEFTLSGIANYIKEEKCRNIIVITGAGASMSAGFTELEKRLREIRESGLCLDAQEDQLSSFRKRPECFYANVKAMYPGSLKPTPSHYFIKLLHEKGLLLRLYTQNVDSLDQIAGIPDEKLVEAHGTLRTAHCLNPSCRKEYSLEWMREKISKHEVPSCTECDSVIKPDMIFLGEMIAEKYTKNVETDFLKCDLAIIMGTSLSYKPFNTLVYRIPKSAPRLLINKEKVGQDPSDLMRSLGLNDGLKFDAEDNYRDVAWLGLCDDGCFELAAALGWTEELKKLIETEHKRLDSEAKEKPVETKSEGNEKSENQEKEARAEN